MFPTIYIVRDSTIRKAQSQLCTGLMPGFINDSTDKNIKRRLYRITAVITTPMETLAMVLKLRIIAPPFWQLK